MSELFGVKIILRQSFFKKKYKIQSYMQGSKGDTDVNGRRLDSMGEGEDGMICENSIEICILPYVK